MSAGGCVLCGLGGFEPVTAEDVARQVKAVEVARCPHGASREELIEALVVYRDASDAQREWLEEKTAALNAAYVEISRLMREVERLGGKP